MRCPISIPLGLLVKRTPAFQKALAVGMPRHYAGHQSAWAMTLMKGQQVLKAIASCTEPELTLDAFDWGVLEHILAVACQHADADDRESLMAAFSLVHEAPRKDGRFRALLERVDQEAAAARTVEELRAQLEVAQQHLLDVQRRAKLANEG